MMVENLTNITIQTQKLFKRYTKIMEGFRSSKAIESLFRSWYANLTPLFPESLLFDQSALDNAKLDFKAVYSFKHVFNDVFYKKSNNRKDCLMKSTEKPSSNCIFSHIIY